MKKLNKKYNTTVIKKLKFKIKNIILFLISIIKHYKNINKDNRDFKSPMKKDNWLFKINLID